MRTGLSRKTSWESRERHPKEKRLFPRCAGSSLGLLGTGRSRWSRRPSEKRAQSHCFPNLRPPETQAHLPWKLLSHLDPFWVDAQETFCSFSSGKGDVPTALTPRTVTLVPPPGPQHTPALCSHIHVRSHSHTNADRDTHSQSHLRARKAAIC